MELNETALVFLVQHKKPDGVIALTPLTSAIQYADTDTNDSVRNCGFSYDGDGHYSSYMFAIPATLDGITTLAGDTLAVDDYYYLVGEGVFLKTVDGPEEVTDYSDLIEVETIIKTQCDKMFYNKLAIKRNDEYYRQYRDARDGNDPQLANELMKQMEDLEVDIAGADYRFRVGLFTVAENIVAELLEKHAII